MEGKHLSRIVRIGWEDEFVAALNTGWSPGALKLTPSQQLCSAGCSVTAQGSRVRLVKVLLYWNSVFLILLPRTHFPVNFTFLSHPQCTKPCTWKKLIRKNETPLLLSGQIQEKKKKNQVKFSHLKFEQEYICLLCWKLSGVLPL